LTNALLSGETTPSGIVNGQVGRCAVESAESLVADGAGAKDCSEDDEAAACMSLVVGATSDREQAARESRR
jgi:hypothetical protein